MICLLGGNIHSDSHDKIEQRAVSSEQFHQQVEVVGSRSAAVGILSSKPS